MKIHKGKYRWSRSELETLEVWFPHISNKQLSKILGFSIRTIIRKARELHL